MAQGVPRIQMKVLGHASLTLITSIMRSRPLCELSAQKFGTTLRDPGYRSYHALPLAPSLVARAPQSGW